MLQKIYVDHYGPLVDFTLSFDEINLLMGTNGSGKSTVFEVLRKLQALLDGQKVNTLFRSQDITRWDMKNRQSFSLEIGGNGGKYRYDLELFHDTHLRSFMIDREALSFNDTPLLLFDKAGDVHLYSNGSTKTITYPFDRESSAVAAQPERPDNQLITWFKARMNRLIVVQVNPMLMDVESAHEEKQLSLHMENFVSWYRRIYQDQPKASKITKAIQEIWPEFTGFKFVEAGERHRLLNLVFSYLGSTRQYQFDELSEGERALIALYTLLHATANEDYTLCIDEPENFLALPEIQPWLTMLYDFCADGAVQAVLISHHPELINYLATSSGYWFEADHNMPVQVRRITQNDGAGLPVADLFARGWLYA